MSLGNKILKLRKEKNLSQEQLGEKINVTRQTISNWELDETAPNPEQLKLLSKTLNISVDELIGNDIKGILEAKVSNTEKLAGIIIKILKGVGILFVVLFVLDVIGFLMFTFFREETTVSHSESVELSCLLNDNEYIIEVGSDGYFNCFNCSNELKKELKENYIDFGDISKTAKSINGYFESKNGNCE